MTSTDVSPLVGRLRLIPDTARRFAVGASAARSFYRLEPELLERLLDAGLPHVGRGPDRLFDDYDLSNSALHLGRMSVQRRAIRSWANSLRTNAAAASTRYRLTVLAPCPAPGHPGPCRYLFPETPETSETSGDGSADTPADGSVDGRAAGTVQRACVRERPDDPLLVLDVVQRGDWPEAGTRVRELVAEHGAADFFMLPEAVRWDPGFFAATGMSDCGGCAARLVRAAAAHGLDARFSFGVLVAKPYSIAHCWAEFRTGGGWTPVDPMLMRILTDWGGLDPAQADPCRSPGPVLHRLADHVAKLVDHNGIWAPVSLPTERL
ncbi:transglutaminase domain-containing protein [Actinomadura viridis]|uniref:Transglutaminase-like domain-containing protein n=1 Tax=Actinomadura viridis TaxID=58110 RepID=A0A931DFK2_9ACTN|nr:transglutaminase domain-containing protein [Actinomadura viridis]MBG6085950.1 hypothetical protein [Actinomadura viridis]